ncbi:hypothetical protein I552_2538 [Mycobacterium xenopi 3993]|nr:hypothetical protein I552_2538 [Mycobacterium xenopi 3993]
MTSKITPPRGALWVWGRSQSRLDWPTISDATSVSLPLAGKAGQPVKWMSPGRAAGLAVSPTTGAAAITAACAGEEGQRDQSPGRAALADLRQVRSASRPPLWPCDHRYQGGGWRQRGRRPLSPTAFGG